MRQKIGWNTQVWQSKLDPISVESSSNADQGSPSSLGCFSVEFGKLLFQHHKDVANKGTDKRAKGFARYLRASRLNAGLTPTELALRAEIPDVMVYGLERGLIHSTSIESAHLQCLARVLGEDLTIFGLLLGRDLTRPDTTESGSQ